MQYITTDITHNLILLFTNAGLIRILDTLGNIWDAQCHGCSGDPATTRDQQAAPQRHHQTT